MEKKSNQETKYLYPHLKKKNTKSILVHIKKVQIEKSFKGYKNDNDY